MEIIDEPFVGGSIEDVSTVLYSIKRGIPVAGLFCICFFMEKGGQLQILSSTELFSPRNKKKHIIVAGVAQGRREAQDLLLFLLETVVRKGYDLTKPQQWIHV